MVFCPCCGFDQSRSDTPEWHVGIRLVVRGDQMVQLSRRETSVFNVLWQAMKNHQAPTSSTAIAKIVYAADLDGGPLNYMSMISQAVKSINARLAPLAMNIGRTKVGYRLIISGEEISCLIPIPSSKRSKVRSSSDAMKVATS